MDITVVVQATLHTEFLIDRREVVEAMAAETRRLGLDATWDWTVYRLPAYRRLLDHAGIGNSVSFALRAGGRAHGRLAVTRDASMLAYYLERLGHLNVFESCAVLACEGRGGPAPPTVVRCALSELAHQLDDVLGRAAATGSFDETLWLVTLPPRTTRAFERRSRSA